MQHIECCMRMPDDLLHLQRSQGGDDERHQLHSRIALFGDDKGQMRQSNLGLALHHCNV